LAGGVSPEGEREKALARRRTAKESGRALFRAGAREREVGVFIGGSFRRQVSPFISFLRAAIKPGVAAGASHPGRDFVYY
jgi:hypothetical protein